MVGQKLALQKLWNDNCTIYKKAKAIDPITKITDFQDVILFENIKCKLSFESISSSDGGHIATTSQSVKLFLDNEIEIPAGCKIVVTRNNRICEYANSGMPAVFTNHQEISLTLLREWV